MEFLDQIIIYIERLDQKKFLQQAGIFLACITLVTGGIVYLIETKRNTEIANLKELSELSQKSAKVIRESEKIKLEEERVRALLDDNKNFSIKTYFEQFCRAHEITPEAGWDTETRSIDGNDMFDEILLPAVFKNQTMEHLVTILNDLDENEIVYIKELEIKNAEQNITFTLTIATKKQKGFWED